MLRVALWAFVVAGLLWFVLDPRGWQRVERTGHGESGESWPGCCDR